MTSSVSHRPSSSPALYFMAATVQQRLHSKLMWATTYSACGVKQKLVVCVLRSSSVCVGMCGSSHCVLEPQINFSFLIFAFTLI